MSGDEVPELYAAPVAELQRNTQETADGRALFEKTCTYVREFDAGGIFLNAEQLGGVTLDAQARVDLCYTVALYEWFFNFEKSCERQEIDKNRLKVATRYGGLANLIASTFDPRVVLYRNVQASQEVRDLRNKVKAVLTQRRSIGNRRRVEADFFLASLARIYSSAGGSITISSTSSFAKFLTAIWRGLPKSIQAVTEARLVVRAEQKRKHLKGIGQYSKRKLPPKERENSPI